MYRISFIICTMTNKRKLIDKLSHSYMFRHYCVILRELVVSTLPSYTSMSKAAVEISTAIVRIARNPCEMS